MTTIYVGVFCPNCEEFVVLTTYEALSVNPPKTHLIIDVQTPPIKCPHCEDACNYRQSDVAHSLSPAGTEPQYPHR